MRSAMKEYATNPKGAQLPRSRFNLGKRHLTTHDGDWLVPINWEWAFPSDVWTGDYDAFLRASAPLEFPLFDNMTLTIHTYYVPLRILWDNARAFFGERYPDPDSSINFTLPEYGSGTLNTGVAGGQPNLLRYLDCPAINTAPQNGIDESDLCAIPVRAYFSIWNWHYRDARQQDSVEIPTDDGPDDAMHALYVVKNRGKRHDYFTSLLASPQSGDSVTIGGEVQGDSGAGTPVSIWSGTHSDYQRLDTDANHADISVTSTAAANVLYPNTTINELRNAAILQQFLERENRYGVRYDEQLYAQYGTEFNDIRVAPVYLGGGKGHISTTSENSETCQQSQQEH